MPRLVSPLGVVVNVSDEKAARLGWVPFGAAPVEVSEKRKPGRPKKVQDDSIASVEPAADKSGE